MTPAAFTPGPWHVGMRPGPMVYGLGGTAWVARCDMETMAHDENAANARLIAAAPALLAFVERVADFAACMSSEGYNEGMRVEQEALHLLAQARGEKGGGK